MTEHTNHSAEGYVTSRIDYDGRNGPLIDLGLGKSPIGAAPELKRLLADRDPLNDLVDYDPDPFHTQTRKLIADSTGIPNISAEAIVLNGNGSYGAGDEVVRYLALKGKTQIIVPNYSFPNVAQWAERHGLNYKAVNGGNTPPHLNPISSQMRMLEMSGHDIRNSIIYIDYPNNPFGIAVYPLVSEIIKQVSKNGGTPLIDLAFGEVLGDEYSQIMRETLDAGGICLGSLTKTQGLAKLRTGWAILPSVFTSNGYSGSQRLVFGINHEADLVCKTLFASKNGSCLAQVHAKRVAEYNIKTNKILYRELEKLGLTVLPSLLQTSIQVVASPIPDLYQRLMTQGIKSESLQDYSGTLSGRIGLGHQAVRLLTPPPGTLDEVVDRFNKATH